MSVVFLDCWPEVEAALTPGLRAIVPELEVNHGAPGEDEIAGLLAGRRAALVFVARLSNEVLAACPDLRLVVYTSTGYRSYIDPEAAEKLGIRVRGIAGYGNRAVAEHAFALALAAARDLAAMDRSLRAGEWAHRDGIELAGRTLGLLGLGGIGAEMARIGAGFGMRVLAWNRSGAPPGLPCEAAGLDAVLAAADVVSLHLALNDETRGIMNRRRLGLMRPGAILVNTARGGLIEETALIEALEHGRLRHAALDVFADEPLPGGHPFTRLDNVTLSPHVAWRTTEALDRLLRTGLETLRDELAALTP